MTLKDLPGYVHRIEALRKERRENRRDMADAIAKLTEESAETVYQRISNWFTRAVKKPDITTMTKIAEHYSVSVTWLLEGGDRPSRRDSLTMDIVQELSSRSEEELQAMLIGLRARHSQDDSPRH